MRFEMHSGAAFLAESAMPSNVVMAFWCQLTVSEG